MQEPHPNRKFHFVAGMKVHQWTLIQSIPDRPGMAVNMKHRWRVQCVCGTRQTLPQYYLTRKVPKQHCGCLHKGLPTLHKLEYNSWQMMKTRCYDSKHEAYHHYGGRGITVCERWLDPENGFKNFLEDMGPRVSQKFSLDRKDVNGNYEKDNCRWATAKEQRANQRKK